MIFVRVSKRILSVLMMAGLSSSAENYFDNERQIGLNFVFCLIYKCIYRSLKTTLLFIEMCRIKRASHDINLKVQFLSSFFLQVVLKS